jgi:hypothetical protein
MIASAGREVGAPESEGRGTGTTGKEFRLNNISNIIALHMVNYFKLFWN